MSYQQLTEGQRYQLSVLRAQGMSILATARAIGVHRSTLYRELRRNAGPQGYQPDNAHQHATHRRASVASKQAGVVRDAIIEMLTPYIEQVHTITFDNGGEFAEHKAIEEALGAETYFAHPYSSWERGLNENSNGLLRQFIPKGTDLREVTDEDVRRAEQWLNLRPRKCLGFRQPVKVFEEYRQAA